MFILTTTNVENGRTGEQTFDTQAAALSYVASLSHQKITVVSLKLPDGAVLTGDQILEMARKFPGVRLTPP